MEKLDESMVRKWRKDGHSYDSISEMLKSMFPNVDKGFSVRTVRRHCKKHKLEKMTEDEVDDTVFEAVQEV